MHRVKIIYLAGSDSWDCNKIVTEGTNWEEISDEDFKILAKNAYLIPKWRDLQPVLLVESSTPAKETVSSIMEKIRLQEQEKQKHAARVAEQKKRRAALKAKASLEEKKNLIEKLKKELEEAASNG